MTRLDPLSRWLTNALLVSLVGIVAACGAGGSRSSLAVEITEARWRGDAVTVSGAWMKGVSTPPVCKLLEGRDGAVIGSFGLEGATFEAGAFSQELVPDTGQDGTNTGYRVRCSVILDSAKTASDTAPVEVPD